MKQTKVIFLLYGEESEVRKVLGTINHYEAVVALSDGSEIDNVIHNNKNVAIKSDVTPEENLDKGIIPIFVGNNIDESNIIKPDNNIGIQFEDIAEKYDIDIGDFIPDGKIKQPTKKDCILCKIYDGRRNQNKKPMDMVIYESENFYVCPAKGAMVKGYLMICPKKHILSCAALPKEQQKELRNVIADISFIMKEIYCDDILMFEHGSGKEGECKHEKSIVHAHLHILPTSIKISEDQRDAISMKEVTFEQLHQYERVPYFLYIEPDQMYITADPDVYIPRQYARQIIAEKLGIKGELWNWRKNDFKSKINDTLMEIAEYLKMNHFRLPIQIRNRTADFLTEMSIRNDVL